MFYVTDTTTELYTWQPKLNGEAMCAASFLEEVMAAGFTRSDSYFYEPQATQARTGSFLTNYDTIKV